MQAARHIGRIAFTARCSFKPITKPTLPSKPAIAFVYKSDASTTSFIITLQLATRSRHLLLLVEVAAEAHPVAAEGEARSKYGSDALPATPRRGTGGAQ